ncbi:MAG: DUF1080 domain-containing protein [Planctomycetes bacterium]|nr:DUF1080 domain-containing protein [Planctomycetota bacterium]
MPWSRVTRHASCLLAALSALLVATTVMAGEGPKEEGFVAIFDGKTLNGWAPRNEPGHGWGAKWEARDGEIVGVQEWPEAWGMLATRRAFGDFELRLEAKAQWPIDSGVLLRATGEGRGYKVSLHCGPDNKDWTKVWKKDGWNDLRVVVRGNPPTVQTWLNGAAMAELKGAAGKPPIAPAGLVGLEINGNREAFGNRIFFRNIRVLELK